MHLFSLCSFCLQDRTRTTFTTGEFRRCWVARPLVYTFGLTHTPSPGVASTMFARSLTTTAARVTTMAVAPTTGAMRCAAPPTRALLCRSLATYYAESHEYIKVKLCRREFCCWTNDGLWLHNAPKIRSCILASFETRHSSCPYHTLHRTQ